MKIGIKRYFANNKIMKKEIKIYNELPKGWRIKQNATTAPNGYVWICNNKSHFSGEYKSGLLKLLKGE